MQNNQTAVPLFRGHPSSNSNYRILSAVTNDEASGNNSRLAHIMSAPAGDNQYSHSNINVQTEQNNRIEKE